MAATNIAMNMNSKAIAWLLQGQHTECMVTLQDALRGFKCDLLEPETRVTTSDCQWATKTVELPGQVQTSDSAFDFFDCAFVFQRESNRGVGVPQMGDQNLVPAVIMYNMGVCRHREAIRQGYSNGLNVASRFYGHALALLEAYAEDLRESDMVLLAALANNMAHISSSFYDMERTRFFQKMLEDIMDITDMEGLEEDEAQLLFSMNLLLTSETNINGVAPAA